MVGKNHFWKLFKKPSFEEEVLKNKSLGIIEFIENKEDIIEKPFKKKTATDIHMEIKNFIEVNDYESARSILMKALVDGYTGKRINAWIEFFKEYDEEVNSTEIIDG